MLSFVESMHISAAIKVSLTAETVNADLAKSNLQTDSFVLMIVSLKHMLQK
jgi:hypothetical protein